MSRKTLSQALLALQGDYQTALLDLHAQRDPEALHRLRICLRRARSLLAPIRRRPGVAPLYQTLSEAARASGPLRDMEVLLAELAARQQAAPAALLAAAQAETRQFLRAEALYQVAPALQQWLALKPRQRAPGGRCICRRLRRRQARWLKALQAEACQAQPDRHRIRLLLKRLRYTVEAYPQARPRLTRRAQTLKQAQALLGNWHDREVWTAAAQRWPELAALETAWAQESEILAAQADALLSRLLPRL